MMRGDGGGGGGTHRPITAGDVLWVRNRLVVVLPSPSDTDSGGVSGMVAEKWHGHEEQQRHRELQGHRQDR